MQEKAKYFQQAKREQLLHKQLYPGWSHGINYVRTTGSNKLLQKKIIAGYISVALIVFVHRVKRGREKGKRFAKEMKVQKTVKQKTFFNV